MSWAPYIHPSGEYVQGEKEPVRVTYTDGFDGLPVPTPDGGSLVWTSTRGSEKGQIYMARWDHRAALEALAESPRREPAEEEA